IVFAATSTGPLMRVAASGGKPERVTTVETQRTNTGHRFPTFLPDGDHFLYAANPGHDGEFDVLVGSRSNPAAHDLLLSAQTAPVFAEPGYLVFVRKGGLVAQPFVASSRRLSGEAAPLADAPGGLGL